MQWPNSTSPTTAIQDAASAVAGRVAGIYNQMRSEAVSKSVRDDYTFLSHCSVAYLMLLTTARSLGEHQTEELAEQGYRDCARLVMDIDQFLPNLSGAGIEGGQASGAGRSSVGAWNRQGTSTTPGISDL